jgi:hypothetical protein
MKVQYESIRKREHTGWDQGPCMQRIRNFRRMKQKKLKKGTKDERVGTEKFSIWKKKMKKSRMRLRRIGSRSKDRRTVKNRRKDDG